MDSGYNSDVSVAVPEGPPQVIPNAEASGPSAGYNNDLAEALPEDPPQVIPNAEGGGPADGVKH